MEQKWRILLREGSFAILIGPTWPCCYYAGRWLEDVMGDVWPSCNDTHYFHRTEDAALDALVRLTARAEWVSACPMAPCATSADNR